MPTCTCLALFSFTVSPTQNRLKPESAAPLCALPAAKTATHTWEKSLDPDHTAFAGSQNRRTSSRLQPRHVARMGHGHMVYAKPETVKPHRHFTQHDAPTFQRVTALPRRASRDSPSGRRTRMNDEACGCLEPAGHASRRFAAHATTHPVPTYVPCAPPAKTHRKRPKPTENGSPAPARPKL